MIKVATKQDISLLLYIEELCFEPIDRFSAKQFKLGINGWRKKIYVYVLNDLIIGYIYTVRSCRNLRIYSLAVHPEYQRLKIGSELLEYIEIDPILNNHSIQNIQLEVRISNLKIHSFYYKHGYTFYDIKERYYPDGESALLLKKDLYAESKTKGRLA